MPSFKPLPEDFDHSVLRALRQVCCLILIVVMTSMIVTTNSQAQPLPSYWSQLPRPQENNKWYDAANRDTAFVFVHGIFSDSRSCWAYIDSKNPANNRYWPELIKDDQRLGRPAIYLGGYYTALDSGPYDARQAAKELRDALRRDGVLDRKNIVFIAHSTGGIVVRYMLYHNQDLFQGRRIGLVLYASPSIGSYLADVLNYLTGFYNQQLGDQLQARSPFLQELDLNFRDLLYNPNSSPNNLKIIGGEAIENFFIVHRWYLPDAIKVVPESSGSRYFGSPTYLRGTDHFSTVKPNGLQHPGHEYLITFDEKFKQETQPTEGGTVEPKKPGLEMRLVGKYHTFFGSAAGYAGGGACSNAPSWQPSPMVADAESEIEISRTPDGHLSLSMTHVGAHNLPTLTYLLALVDAGDTTLTFEGGLAPGGWKSMCDGSTARASVSGIIKFELVGERVKLTGTLLFSAEAPSCAAGTCPTTFRDIYRFDHLK